MIKAIFSILALAVGLTALMLFSGYLDYRRDMNTCLEAGGIVIKTSNGLKCIPRGEVKLI
jgi:hypothetical protein